MKTTEAKRWLLSALLIIGLLYVIYPFIFSIIWAVLFSTLLFPAYHYMSKKINHSSAALLVVSGFTLIILIPLLIFISFGLNNLLEFFNNQQSLNELIKTIQQFLDKIPVVGSHLNQSFQKLNIQKNISNILNVDTAKNVLPAIQATGLTFINFVIKIFVTIVLMFQMLLHGDQLLEYAHQKILKDLPNNKDLSAHIANNIQAIFLNMLLTSVIAFIAMGTTYFILGFENFVSLAFITGLLALIPFLLPVFYILFALILLMNHYLASAIVILIVGFLINFITDNIIQPKLLSEKAQLNFAISLVGILAGLEVFGIIGLFLGPIFLNVVYLCFAKS